MNKHYEELQLLFELDPLLVLNVAYICPRCDIAYLCDKIHLPYAIALVNEKTCNSKVLERDQETKVRCTHVTCM